MLGVLFYLFLDTQMALMHYYVGPDDALVGQCYNARTCPGYSVRTIRIDG
jgi:hypothetical protein